MYYELIVLKKVDKDGKVYYEHLFATSRRSAQDKWAAKKLYDELIQKFPAPEYGISIVYYENAGKYLKPEDLR